MSTEISGHIGQDVDDDFLKIVESAAQETVSKENGRAAGTEEADDLDMAVEIIEEDGLNNAKSRKKRDENVRAKNGGRMLIDAEEAETAKEDAVEEELLDAAETAVSDEEEEMMEISVGPAGSEKEETASEEENDVLAVSESAEVKAAEEVSEDLETELQQTEPAEDRDEMEERLEQEISSQAEEFVELLKSVPEEIREEVRKNNFQNLSFRVVKLPGSLIFGKTASEYYVIRTMEYTGSALSHDYQALHLSSAYMKWMESLEKYLDTMALDENNHEIWVEAPEYWNSEAE